MDFRKINNTIGYIGNIRIKISCFLFSYCPKVKNILYLKQKQYNPNNLGIIIYEGLLAKFSQNEFLKSRLLDTKNSILAECAVKDRIWGIGLSLTDPKRLKNIYYSRGFVSKGVLMGYINLQKVKNGD